MLARTKVAALCAVLVTGCLVVSSPAIEVTEQAGAAHGYPGLRDSNGRKIADGEFRQWVEDHRLNVVITYRLPNGQLWEEKARFRQGSDLV